MSIWAANVVLGVSAFFIVGNWIGIIGATYTKVSYSFALPFVAGIAGMLAALAHPSPAVSSLAWLPLALDPTIGFALCWFGMAYLKKKL